MLLRCCLIYLAMRHNLYLVYMCPCLGLGLFILYLCELFFICDLYFYVTYLFLVYIFRIVPIVSELKGI